MNGYSVLLSAKHLKPKIVAKIGLMRFLFSILYFMMLVGSSVEVYSAPEISKEKAAAPALGKQTYDRFCITCHQDGLIGAPKLGNAKDWEPRLKGKKMDDLVAIATKGLNAMPPKGTCTECSDDALKQAIEYMLPHHDKE